MSIVAKKDTNFVPAPEGQWRAVCCDVVDLGVIETKWQDKIKKQHKIRVVFQIEEINPENNKPYLVSQRFTLSMHEMARLRQFLESWRGKAYTEDEANDGVDVELMVGVNAVIQITHNVRNGTTWANIISIMKPMKGMEKLEVQDYIRVKDRPPEQDAKTISHEEAMSDFPEALGPDETDDLPF